MSRSLPSDRIDHEKDELKRTKQKYKDKIDSLVEEVKQLKEIIRDKDADYKNLVNSRDFKLFEEYVFFMLFSIG